MIRIYGASDDLIEIESDDQSKFRSEEFPFTVRGFDDNSTALIAISDGTLLDIDYDRFGIWRFTPLNEGLYFSHIEQAADEYTTDFVVLVGYPRWIVLGTDVVRASGR